MPGRPQSLVERIKRFWRNYRSHAGELKRAGHVIQFKPEPEIRFLGDLRRLHLEPGDTLVLRANEPLTAERIETLRSLLEGCVPQHKVIVLDGRLELGILGATKAAA